MKKFLLIILLSFSFLPLFAKHIKGGFFTYTYLGKGINDPSKLRFKITLTVYMLCPPDLTDQQVSDPINFTIFKGNSSVQFANPIVRKTGQNTLGKLADEPCILGRQDVCFYTIVTYELNNYELPVSPDGYTISYQRCCRINDMDNITNSGDVGNTYTIRIPGTNSPVPGAETNSSPDFPTNDTIVVCKNSYFSYPFKAIDPDGDSLVYFLCNAYIGGTTNAPDPNPSSSPPYGIVPYSPTFSGSAPLGAKVSINSRTGLISGVAPDIQMTGEYVITVCVGEYRNGILFAQSRKELHLRVNDCTQVKASLPMEDITCDGFTFDFNYDIGVSPSGTEYLWNFGDTSTHELNTSTLKNPTHTFSDSGIYLIKLKASLSGFCADSGSYPLKVYPGFFPDLITTGPLCKGVPVQFQDATITKYGAVTGWQWNFGDPAVNNDVSLLQNPTYTYPLPGIYKVKLISGNTKGCIDSVFKDVVIREPLPLTLTNDTLICIIDTLKLTATGDGNIVWSPDYNISSLTSHTPLVSPDVFTTYSAKLTDAFGCISHSDVSVDVRSDIFVDAGKDTTICQTDTIRLSAKSEALQYSWTPNLYLSDASVKNPAATPLSTQKYHVVANLGKCQKEDDITITVVPYPGADAGKDESLCIGLSAQLNATGGSKYSWWPADFLTATNIPNPVSVKPTQTTQYVVTVTDVLGCPKAANDTVVIKVNQVIADAGPPDTSIVINEPLFLNATGGDGDIYQWSPSTWLDNPGISNPVARPQNDIVYTVLIKTIDGCFDRDSIKVKIYRVPADLYVPTAFTPNNDGLNDVFSPVLLGIRLLTYFRIYNRWGELVFSTTQHGKGWDGTYNGTKQDPGNYTWVTEGITYEGKKIQKKGNVILIR